MPLSRVQPEKYSSLLAQKVDQVIRAMSEFNPPAPAIFPSSPTGFRLRAEFSMHGEAGKLNYAMFRREQPKTPVIVRDFPIADERIQKLMPVLRQLLEDDPILSKKLFQIEFLATLSGDVLVSLLYHRHLDQGWENAARQMLTTMQRGEPSVSLVGRSRKQKVVLGNEYVQETFSIRGTEYRFRQYEQSFSQPNGQVNICMITWACEQAESFSGDLLELYCGNGNFTLPLSRYFDSVIATETSKVSVRAAQSNIIENGIENVFLARLSAEEVAQAINAQREFRRLRELPRPLHQFNLDTLFVDPPRAGLDDATVAMAARFPTIIYVSCNPETLVANLRSLHASHSVEHFALFDQFPYTDHMECAVVLNRR